MTKPIVAAVIIGAGLLLANASSANAFQGRRLINAAGGVHESASQENGSIALSGIINFNRSGGADAVQVTITLEDSGGDSIHCVLSTASDVSYALNDGAGTLTLKVDPTDACTAGNSGDLIIFNFVTLTNSVTAGRITATSINLHDSGGDLVDLTTASGAISTL